MTDADVIVVQRILLLAALAVLAFGFWASSSASETSPPTLVEPIPEVLAFQEELETAPRVVPAESTSTTVATALLPVDRPDVDVDRQATSAYRFHRIANTGDFPDGVPVHSAPDVDAPVIDFRPLDSVIMHAGSTAHDEDDIDWMNVTDGGSRIEHGWVRSTELRPHSGIGVHNADGSSVDFNTPTVWESGVEIIAPRVVGVSCDAVQVEIRSAANHDKLSSHVLYSSTEPVAERSTWEDPNWTITGGEVFIRPRDSVIFTLPARDDEPTSYWFVRLDEDDKATTLFDFNGKAVLNEERMLTARDAQEVSVTAVC